MTVCDHHSLMWKNTVPEAHIALILAEMLLYFIIEYNSPLKIIIIYFIILFSIV